MEQTHFFPDEPLPRLVEVFPSVVARWLVARDRNTRYTGHYLGAQATRIRERMTSWSNSTDLLESGAFVGLWFTFWNGLEEAKMSSKKAGTNFDSKPQWKGFVERPLSDEELSQCDAWQPPDAELIEALSHMAETGYDVKLSYNSGRKVATATMIDNRPRLATSGYALSAMDGNCGKAYKMLVYKHYHLLEQSWDALLATPPRPKRG